MAQAQIVDLTDPDPNAGPELWENYHKIGTARLKKRWALRSGDARYGRIEICEAAKAVQKWLQDAQAEGVPVRPVGGAWSLSNIQLVQDGWMLNTRRYNRCFKLKAEDFARPEAVKAEAFMLIEGGVQVDEVNDKLEAMDRSLSTTGASNGQTFPGACATGTHGSVFTAGGIQQHVRAVQIVTPGGIHWIEPAAGLMSDDFINATGSTPLRDDDAFLAALVAVGSLGVVTAMVIEAEPIYLIRPYLRLIDFSREDVEALQRGDFRSFSEKHGLKELGEPYFVMVITTPYKPWGGKAVVRFLYKRDYQKEYEHIEPGRVGPGYDAQSIMSWALRQFPWARGKILQLIMRAGVGNGFTREQFGTWGETLETPKPMGNSFSAALFCDRNRLMHTLEALCNTFARAGGSTAVTIRFVRGGTEYGLLTPARWKDSAVIDCDGPGGEGTRRAYCAMLDALEKQGIEHTLHWGKINNLDRERVQADYGEDLVRWKAVRDRLLPTPADRRLFATRELEEFGLA